MKDVPQRQLMRRSRGSLTVRMEQFSGHDHSELALLDRRVQRPVTDLLQYVERRGSRLQKSMGLLRDSVHALAGQLEGESLLVRKVIEKRLTSHVHRLYDIVDRRPGNALQTKQLATRLKKTVMDGLALALPATGLNNEIHACSISKSRLSTP